MKLILIILLVFFSEIGFSQYKEVPLTREESRKGILRHYQIADDYASAHLYLFKNKRFRFESFTCLSNNYSEGAYQQTEKALAFTSDLQKGTLPVLIEYCKRDSMDKYLKRIAHVEDLESREVGKAFVYINDDSTSCIYGDYFCTKEAGAIDSIKVVLENGASSGWVRVNGVKDIIQIRLQTKGDLSKYTIYNGRFQKKGKILEALSEE